MNNGNRQGWKECKLGDVAAVQTGPFGSQLHLSDYKTVGTPIVTVEHIGDNRIIHSDIPLVGEDDKARLIKYTLKTGDIVFSRVGSVDRCAYIHESENGWMFSGRLLRVRSNPEKVNPRFLSFYFSQEAFKETIRMIAVGATMPSINTGILSEVDIILPPLSEQRAIAGVLSSLDDKIDLLHRQNKTLEGMAEALWRKMFVEEAKETWEEIPLTEILDFLEGPGIRNWQYTNSGTRFINIRLINDGEIDVSKASYVSAEEANTKYKHFLLQEDDMIVSTSGTLGKTAIVRSYHLPLMLNTSVIRFRPKDGKSYSFLYQYLKSARFQNHLEETATGSVQPNFGPVHLKQMKLSSPPREILNSYLNIADKIYGKIKGNYHQIRTLSKMRDTLLPKLMSGEVRVNDE